MSFDIFLQCFRKGEPEPISLELFESIFLPHATHPKAYKDDPGYLTLEYPDGSGGVLYCGGIATDGHMMFNHCGGESFWADIYQLAERTGSVIFWPSAKPPSAVVTNEAILKELPPGSFNPAHIRLIHNGSDIVKVIEASF